MIKMGEKRPILFEIILIAAAFIAASVFSVAGSAIGADTHMSSSIGMIVVGIVLMIIFRSAFSGGRVFGNPVYALPALLFAAWNLFYNLSSGAELGGASVYTAALITALGPGIFEEVIFRGIFIHNLKARGYKDILCLLVSALIFSAAHIINIVGLDAVSVALQVGYSFVVGLVLAAIYLRNKSILEIICIHFLIDFTNRIYIDPAASSSRTQQVIFVVLLVAEAAYALWLTIRKEEHYDQKH